MTRRAVITEDAPHGADPYMLIKMDGVAYLGDD